MVAFLCCCSSCLAWFEWVEILLLSGLNWVDCVEMVNSCDVCVCMNWDRNRILLVISIARHDVDDVIVVIAVVVDVVACCYCCCCGC